MATQFTWIPIYQELADELVNWENRQTELIQFLENLREKGFVITPLQDKDEDGAKFLLEEIDPFTFFGSFNRQILEDNRLSILAEVKKFFSLESALPSDFDGVPVLNNLRSWFFSYRKEREIDDIKKLWMTFKSALINDPLQNKAFHDAFDEAMQIKGVNVILTMGLFWIRPYTFLSLDSRNCEFFKIKLPSTGLSADFYVEVLDKTSSKEKTFPELSYDAWVATSTKIPDLAFYHKDVDYWLVGAYWFDHDPTDQTERFLYEGIWINGYEDQFHDEVKSMKVGDKIAIKSSFTKRKGLPFDNRNKTISVMRIKAIGRIVANRGDGQLVEVEWEPNFEEKDWYFYTNRRTVWRLPQHDDEIWQKVVDQLINFVWYGGDQKYNDFINLWWGDESDHVLEDLQQTYSSGSEPYSIDDIVASGVFLTKEEIEEILKKLSDKKAIIIQGPPGVGKTFIARKLAYALMQEKANDRLEFVQFHQSYSYDDFIRGYRPSADEVGLFKLQNGVFFDFCESARNDPDREYVFIIDEINRGNLSQIFGEVLMLIERDKRGKDFSVPLVYRKEDEPRFYVPSNLYLIGLMNLADRSLAMVDYALRRRFGFITLKPQFESDIYRQWLDDRSMSPDLIDLIITKLSALNKLISEDPVLGENYQIGHSFFCPRGDDFSGLDKHWYESIIHTEIIPLLKEYWFDDQSKVDNATDHLLN
ncbi:MAG TPA: AAA family ATPase [Brevefilum sp.]|nr:AAA family ATPase [Brevefilum sp.]HPL69095.1 AAA family ATPase [Brevefilum sp.]